MESDCGMLALRVVSLALIIVAVATGSPVISQTAAGSRIALVIGNAKYRDAETPPATAIADAAAVSAELNRQGYSVDAAEDTTKADMVERTERLLRDVQSGSTVVLYFNGYAIQSGRQNYLIPIDGNIWTETDIQRDGLNVGQLLAEISRRGASVIYVILEGANRNPYERRFRSFSTGLAPIGAVPAGTTIAYSAAPGAAVRPATGSRGVFSSELVKQISSASGMSPDVLERTRTAVANASSNAQVPWVLSNRREVDKPVDTVTSPPSQPSQPSKPADTASKPAEPTKPSEPTKPATAPSKPSDVASKPAGDDRPASSTTTKKPVLSVLPYSDADDKLRSDLTAAISKNPNDVVSLYTRGQLYALHYDFPRALNDFDHVVRLSPKDVEALNNRCWVRAVSDDLDAALADCNLALKLRPEFLDALDSRGFIMLKIGLPRRAITDYDAALKLNAKHASALYGRGIARVRLGETSSGNSDMKLGRSLDPEIGEQFAMFGVQ